MRTIGPVALLCATLWAVDADAQLRAAAALPTPRSDHGAVVLADGRVLFAGGIGQTLAVSSSTVLYDPVADAWSAGAPLAAPRIDFPLARLASGRVLAVSGYAPTVGINEPSAEIYDPVSNAWSAAGSLSTPRRFHAATTLDDGRVLVTGGQALLPPRSICRRPTVGRRGRR